MRSTVNIAALSVLILKFFENFDFFSIYHKLQVLRFLSERAFPERIFPEFPKVPFTRTTTTRKHILPELSYIAQFTRMSNTPYQNLAKFIS